MHIKAMRSEKGNKNTGTCAGLVEYLEKENKDLQALQQQGRETEKWFNASQKDIEPTEVINHIDHNKQGLKKEEAKFYELDISPSKKELAHIKQQAGDDYSKMATMLKDYTAQKVIDEYAKAAGQRMNKGNMKEIKKEDIVWYGKVEYNRYYKHTDPEVKTGAAKKGQIKEGDNMHVQVIVSAKTTDQINKISPLANERGNSKGMLNGKEIGKGFNRKQFSERGEKAFDTMFRYKREVEESFGYYNIMKNGTLEQKAAMQIQKNMGKGRQEEEQQKLLTAKESNYDRQMADKGFRFQFDKSLPIQKQQEVER